MNKIVLCALVSACLSAVVLTAQTREEQSDIEVFVTASRVEEPAEEVQAHVSVITAEELTASGQTTLVEALDGLAGIRFRSFSGNAALAEISMRGFGENSHGRVLVLLDGRRLNRPDLASINWLEIPVKNVERVEVVRGGSSILYGDNAVAGVINIITKRGAAGFDVEVSSQYGSYNQNQEGVEVSGVGKTLSFSITGEHTSTDGYRDRSAFRSVAFGGSVGMDLERFSSQLSLAYNRLFYELPGALDKAEFDADPTQAQPGHDADEALGNYLNADLSLSFAPLEPVVLEGNAGYRLRLIRSDIPSFPSFTDLTLHSAALTPKATLKDVLLRGNRLVIGVDGYYDQADLDSYLNSNRDATNLETRIRKTTLGAYVADDWALLPFLTVNAGVRYEVARISAETLKTSGTPIDDDKLHQALVYDLGLLFKPLPDLKVWAGYGTVFRYPFVDEQVSIYGFPFDTFYSDLDPERGYDFEVGLETGPAEWLRVVASGYLLDMSDEIAVDPVTFANVNLDKTRHLGAEAEIQLDATKWLVITGNYTFTLATFRDGTYKDNRVPLVPLHQVAGTTRVDFPLGFTLSASGSYLTEAYAAGDLDNDQSTLPDYLLVGVSVRYHPSYLPGKLDVFVGVDNLFDVAYATMGVYSVIQGKVFYYPGEGRNWKVGASYRY
jgi:iron complex outermembrane receptor protein